MSNSSLEPEEDDVASPNGETAAPASGNAEPSDVADEADGFAGQAAEKVQLDIEDAMFLAEPEPEVAPEVEDTSVSLEETAEESAKPLSRVLIAVALLVIAIGIAIVVWFAYFEPATDLSRVPAPLTVVVVPSPEQPPISTEKVVTLAPFMIEDNRDGKVSFLETQFALVVDGEDLYRDIIEKNLILRDAIYYYLHNQEASFLFESKNIKDLKNVLEGIVNGHLGAGKLKELLIVQYLIR